MGAVIRLMFRLFNFALAVGMAGGLVDLTIAMSKNAWKANQIGLVSMKNLTRQLMTPGETERILKYGYMPKK